MEPVWNREAYHPRTTSESFVGVLFRFSLFVFVNFLYIHSSGFLCCVVLGYVLIVVSQDFFIFMEIELNFMFFGCFVSFHFTSDDERMRL